MNSSINSMSSPINWGVDENKAVANSKEILNLSKTLQFLEKNPNWMQQHANEPLAKEIANKAFTTKAPGYLKSQMERLQRALENVPELVPLVTIKIGGKEEQIPKETLMLRSELFKSSLTNTNTGKKNLIELNTQDTNEEAIQLFLEFLRYGKIDFDEEIQDLYHLAASYNVVGLQEQIEAYLEENLDEDNLADIYEFALSANSDSVKNSCFRMILKNPELREKIESSEDERDNPLKGLLDSVKNWDHLAASYKVAGLQALIEVYLEENLDEDSLINIYDFGVDFNSENIINSCFQFVSQNASLQKKIKSSEDHTYSNLKNLVKTLPDWKKKIKEKCLQLAPKAERTKNGFFIDFNHLICEKLTAETALKLNEIKYGIDALLIFDLDEADLQKLSEIIPRIKKLNISYSDIKVLPHAWQASLKTVEFYKCPNLIDIKLACTGSIGFNECKNLATFETPNASSVSVRECKNLINFSAPKASEYVNVWKCKRLINLSAPEAERIIVEDCKNLINLSAPYASAQIKNCPNLESINIGIYNYYAATDLKKLRVFKALLATHVRFSCCPELKQIAIQKVQTIIIEKCDSLERKNIEVPETTQFYDP